MRKLTVRKVLNRIKKHGNELVESIRDQDLYRIKEVFPELFADGMAGVVENMPVLLEALKQHQETSAGRSMKKSGKKKRKPGRSRRNTDPIIGLS